MKRPDGRMKVITQVGWAKVGGMGEKRRGGILKAKESCLDECPYCI